MTFLRGLAGFLIGAIAGAALAPALFETAAQLFNISQMEGAYAMGVVFFYMPLGAVIGGIIGTIWMTMRRGRRT